MTLNPATGCFDVQVGEVITITVTATNTQYAAAFPPAPSCTNWSAVAGPAGGVESRTFIVPGPAGGLCTVDIVFGFISDASGQFPEGAKYDIRISSSTGQVFNDDPVTPPPPQDRAYCFRIG